MERVSPTFTAHRLSQVLEVRSWEYAAVVFARAVVVVGWVVDGNHIISRGLFRSCAPAAAFAEGCVESSVSMYVYTAQDR